MNPNISSTKSREKSIWTLPDYPASRTVSTILRLMKILDVSSDYLLGLTNVKVPMDSTTEKESELLQTFREMDEQKQNYVLESTSILSKYQDDKKSK